MSSAPIEYSREGAIGIIRLNNPPLNLNTRASTRLMDNILAEIEKDGSVRVVVVTAVGRAFSAGSNMKEFPEYIEQGTIVEAKMATEVRVFNRFAYLPQPTIAALDASAFGGGFEFSLAADMRIAAPNIVLSLPEVNLGVFPGSGGSYRLTRLIGYARSIKHQLFGERMTAQEALALGVVNAIAETGTAFELAMDWARQLANKSAVATRAIKEALLEIHRVDQPRLNEHLLDLSRRVWAGGDVHEGMTAFMEKRQPRFEPK